MKHELHTPDLRNALPPEPDFCHRALMQAAGSVKEDEPVKKNTFRALLIAALLIVTMITVAFAATRLMGWADFFGNSGHIGVPKAAVEEMQVETAQSWEVGPLTFTLKELMTDGHIVFSSVHIAITDGSPALLCIDPYDVLGCNGENGRAYAEKLGLDHMTTWLDAAKQLNLPLYNVRGILDMVDDRYDGGMEDPMWNEDGSMTYCSMLFFKNTEAKDAQDHQPFRHSAVTETELPVNFFLRAAALDTATGEETEHWINRDQTATVAVSSLLAERTYLPREESSFSGFRLDYVHAQQYATGAYLYTGFTADETLTPDDAYMFYECLTYQDEQGNTLPGGMDMSAQLDTSAWPQVVLIELYGVETLPERIRLVETRSVTVE